MYSGDGGVRGVGLERENDGLEFNFHSDSDTHSSFASMYLKSDISFSRFCSTLGDLSWVFGFQAR